jgi:hypothetical protein
MSVLRVFYDSSYIELSDNPVSLTGEVMLVVIYLFNKMHSRINKIKTRIRIT